MYQRINIDIFSLSLSLFSTRVYPLKRYINFEDVKCIKIERREKEVKPFSRGRIDYHFLIGDLTLSGSREKTAIALKCH